MRMITIVQGFLLGLVASGPLLYPGAFTFSLANLVWYRVVGVGMVVFSVGLGLLAAREMGSSFTIWPKPRDPAVGGLVTTGVFKYTRNPIYLALIIASYGWSLSQWSIVSLLASAVLRFWLSVKISKEEEFLEEQWGDAYLDYVKKTARIIPGIGRG